MQPGDCARCLVPPGRAGPVLGGGVAERYLDFLLPYSRGSHPPGTKVVWGGLAALPRGPEHSKQLTHFLGHSLHACALRDDLEAEALVAATI